MSREGKKKSNNQQNRFSVTMQKKLVVLFVFVLLAFAGLCARLVWITREKGTEYQKQVLSQQRYDSITIPYRRGDIVDSNGIKLATSEKVYNLVLEPKVMLDNNSKYLETTLTALAANFPELDMSAVREYINSHEKSYWYVPLKRMTYDQISGFQAAQLEDTNIKGVWFEEEYRRFYPNGSLAADAIGFVSTDNSGMYGMEEYYNEELNGTTGREYGYLNDDSTLERTVKPAVDGDTVHSTIDANLQSIVEKYILKFHEEHKNKAREGNGAENIGVVMQNPQNGEILAMASYPTFDLNDTRNTDALIGSNVIEAVTNANGYTEYHKTTTVFNEQVLAEMSEEQILLNLNELWKNFCISTTYEPGSTAKPFTIAAALETGAITGNETYWCDGSLEVGGHDIKCHNIYGDGAVTVRSAVATSCNVALMRIGLALGAEEFSKYQDIFNFGLKTNIDLAGEARTASLLYPVEQMKPVDLATNSFGQNFNVTMIQMVTGYSSLINGGYYYEPHIVNKITNSSGATVQNIEPRVLKQTVSESTSELIRQYTKAVADEGTGVTARPAGYSIGGKTGTAQTLPRGNREYIVSFIAHAPADDPQVVVYVVLDRLNEEKQDAVRYATIMTRDILTEALPYMNIYMTEELSEKEIQELNEKQLEITTQYTKKPEDEALEGTEEGTEDEGNQVEPIWKSYPIQEGTGYRVNPETGEVLDAETGDAINGSYQPLDADVPVNPNISNPQTGGEEGEP